MYTGDYHNDGYGTIRVRYRNDQITMNYIDHSELMHYNKDTFQSYQLFKYFLFRFVKK